MKRLWPLLLVLMCMSCAFGGSGRNTRSHGNSSGENDRYRYNIEVRLENYTFTDATVYIMEGSFSRPAGRVGAIGKTSKTVSMGVAGVPVRFFAKFLASYNTWLSHEIFWVQDAGCVVVRLEPNLAHSSVVQCRR